MLSVHIDYYSGVAYLHSLEECEEFCNQLASLLLERDELTFEVRSRRLGENFTHAVDSVWGIFGAYRRTPDKAKLAFQLPGEFCRKISDQQQALKFLADSTCPTRIDIALDDAKRRISQSKLNEIAMLGFYKGVNSYKFIESKPCQDGETGATCQFGRSDKVIRFYNAEVVHGLDADRWELQSRSDRACQITQLLAFHGIQKYAGAIVTSSIDFVDKSQNWWHEIRFPFWQELRDETNVKALEAIGFSLPSDVRSIDKAIIWLKRQVSPTLKIIYQAYGRQAYLNFLEALATDPNIRLTPQQESWINYLRRANEPLNP